MTMLRPPARSLRAIRCRSPSNWSSIPLCTIPSRFRRSAAPASTREVDAALFEDTGADAVLDVVPATALQHHRLDAMALEQPGQGQARLGRRRRCRPGPSIARRERLGPGRLLRTGWPGRSGRPAAAARAASETTRRAPLIPRGWPMAMAPPFTLTISGEKPSSRITARL